MTTKRDHRLTVFLATGFGLGSAPVAPGTLGTLPGVALAFGLSLLPLTIAVPLLLAFIGASVRAADAAEKALGAKDPGAIVIDEIAGMAVTLIAIPFTWKTAVAGFFLFRVLDILKPFPIRALEKRIPGGLGVVADDVMAGVMANLIIRLVMAL